MKFLYREEAIKRLIFIFNPFTDCPNQLRQMQIVIA